MPDDESLEIAARIARSLGIEMDPKTVRTEALSLHFNYFREIIERLKPDVAIERVRLMTGSSRRLNASLGGFGDIPTIGMDELLDFWLATVSHLTVVVACRILESDERQSLLKLFGRTLECRYDPYIHEEIRHDFLPFVTEYSKEMGELSHPLSKAMIAFVYCHEIAHLVLGHADREPSPENELNADQLATKFYRRLIETSAPGQYVYISPKLAGAPILMVRFLQASDDWHSMMEGVELARSSHPHPRDRARVIADHTTPEHLNAAGYFHGGLIQALADISDGIGLAPLATELR